MTKRKAPSQAKLIWRAAERAKKLEQELLEEIKYRSHGAIISEVKKSTKKPINDYIKWYAGEEVQRIIKEEIEEAQKRSRSRIKSAVKDAAAHAGRMFYLENCFFCVGGICTFKKVRYLIGKQQARGQR